MSVLAPNRPAPRLAQAPPVRRHHAVLPANPRAVAGARRLVRTAIRIWGIPVDAETAALLVSELVTNAVTHDRGEPGTAPVSLTIAGDDDHLRVDVHDTSLALPVIDEVPAAHAEHGRGLLLVDTLAATWGCYPTAAGKAVYFTLVP